MNIKKIKDNKYLFPFIVTSFSFFISFFSLIFIPFSKPSDNNGISRLDYTIALLFWLFLILGCVCVRWTGNKYRKLKKEIDFIEKQNIKHRPGIVTFHFRAINIVVYFFILAGVLLIVSELINHWMSEYLFFTAISITFFMFSLHCIIDGESFQIYKLIKEGVNYE